ncbi:MAG: 2TM domain-containing protein [Actinobacteria bacterium]|nr:2TM domain-containing protein [Actinomycetota bacterium]
MSVTIPPDRTKSPLEDPLRAQAVASLKRKRKFWEDLVAYLSVNGVLWLIWALTDRSMNGSMPWPAWVSAIWGFLLLLDAMRAFGSWPGSGPITEAEIEREMRRHDTGS